MATFTPVARTTVLGNADDWIRFEDLPNPTRFQTLQVLANDQGARDDFLVTDGFFDANFGTGTYEWLLTADGYDDYALTITATKPPYEEPPVDEGGDE